MRSSFLFSLVIIFLLSACAGLNAPMVEPSSTLIPSTPTQVTPSPTVTPSPMPRPVMADPFPVEPIAVLPQGSQGFPWWNDTVFYQIFVRSFYDSDGDGFGDLNGVLQKLDYLNDGNPATVNDLGITGIWLMPIFPSPTYHGYDATDYFSVNPDYGTLEDFQLLLQEAHRRGIRVIIDLMLNHTSNQHPWFQQALNPASPYRDWYIWSENYPGYNGPWGQQVWHLSPNGDYYFGIFWQGMPDLNFNNPQVTAKMLEVAHFWLQEVGVDGFRLDAVRHLIEAGQVQNDTPATHSWLKDFYAYHKKLSPENLTVGEIWTTSDAIAPYIQGEEVDIAFDFNLASKFLASANGTLAKHAIDQMVITTSVFPPGQFATFLTNHDMNRAMTQLGDELEKAKNAATLLLTSPGVPFIYYGEEIGMTGMKPDELIRTPMQWSGEQNGGFSTVKPWQALKSNTTYRNVEVQTNDPSSLLSLYRTLIELRNQHQALRIGEVAVVSSKSLQVYSILRYSADEAILVVVNLSDDYLDDYALSLPTGPLQGAYNLAALLDEGQFAELVVNSNGGFDNFLPLPSLPPHARLIIQLQPIEQ